MTTIESNLSFDKVKSKALTSIESILTRWLPNGRKQGHEYTTVNPTRSDNNPGSFSVNVNTGQWADFATDDKGGDLISLIAYLENIEQVEAKNLLADYLGLKGNKENINDPVKSSNKNTSKDWIPVTPVPLDAPPPIKKHFKYGEPTSIWEYKDQKNKSLCYVYRFDIGNNKKQILPVTYCKKGNQHEWRFKGLSAPRPLYNLHLLEKSKNSNVIICEGEKAADAATQLFPDFVITTMLNGAKSTNKTNWSTLRKRIVYLWPDNDEAGQACMEAISHELRKANAKEIKIINLEYFNVLPNGSNRVLPDKWDAADALIEGYTPNQLKDFFNNKTNLITSDKLATKKEDSGPFHIFENKDGWQNGIYYDDGNELPKRICGILRVTARTRNKNGMDWGYLLEWKNEDGIPCSWAMPAEALAGSGEEYRSYLLSSGLDIEAGYNARKHLASYIQSSNTEQRALCTESTGWHDNLYVLPDKTIGNSQGRERIIFQTSSGAINTFKQKGTIEDWQKNVAALCKGNSRLLFAVSAAFAGIVVGLVEADSAGFHFRGNSSTGKTTALRVAASVFGGKDYIQRWRATDNGLESLAAQHRDACLILDELAQVDPKAAGDVAYMLANGQGKTRANRNGYARQRLTWRMTFLSAGEIGLSEHMQQAGKKIRAGQEIRLLDIPADAGKGNGLFEEIHDSFSPSVFSKLISEAASKYYGTPAIEFIEQLHKQMDIIADLISNTRKDFLKDNLPENASGQADRAARMFALVGAAGEIATRLKITGWDKGEAMQATTKCFHAWLTARGGAGSQEEKAIIEQFSHFFELHGESRFTWIHRTDDHAPRTMNRAGYKDKVSESDTEPATFYVFPEVYKNEICAGFDINNVTKLLISKNIIQPDSSGKSTQVKRLPEGGRKRMYYITPWPNDE